MYNIIVQNLFIWVSHGNRYLNHVARISEIWEEGNSLTKQGKFIKILFEVEDVKM